MTFSDTTEQPTIWVDTNLLSSLVVQPRRRRHHHGRARLARGDPQVRRLRAYRQLAATLGVLGCPRAHVETSEPEPTTTEPEPTTPDSQPAPTTPPVHIATPMRETTRSVGFRQMGKGWIYTDV